MSIDQATLAKRLRKARTNSGLSQEQVAQELGIPRTALVHIESGSRTVSTIEMVGFAASFAALSPSSSASRRRRRRTF